MIVHGRRTKGERRQHTRFVTAFEAELHDGEESRTVIVGDLSAGGALIEGNHGLHVGQKVRLTANDLDVEASIMWMRDDLCGARLSQMIDPLEVVRVNSRGMADLRERLVSAAVFA